MPSRCRSRSKARSNSDLCGAPHKAEFERDLIVERTQAGLSSARARGRKGGRPKGLSAAAEKKAIAAEALYKEGRLGVDAIAENLGVSKATLYKAQWERSCNERTYKATLLHQNVNVYWS